MRIVALSDQHGHLPEIPPCDLLLVAGDVCPDGLGSDVAAERPDRQREWFDAHARPWLAKAPATHKILTWGNHDWCGQVCHFESGSPGAAEGQILVDALTTVSRSGPGGRSISVWASPWSREFASWAFMKSPDGLVEVYAAIPEGTDILVSHQPPYRHGDRYDHPGAAGTEHLGSTELLEAIRRIRPRLVVCGHLHGGHGRYVYKGVPIYNVSVVNDDYQLIRPPTVIDIPEW